MPVWIRVLVTAGLLALVVSRVEWSDVRGAVARAEPTWIAIALLAFNAALIGAARRWQLVVAAGSAGRAPIGFRTAVGATYISLWLSNFLPTAFGGDVARVLAAHRAGAAMPVAVAGAVLDRYVGLLTLASLFLVSELVSARSGQGASLLPLAGSMATGFAVLLVGVWAGARVPLRRRWLRRRAVRFAARAIGLLRVIGSKPASCARIGGASLVAVTLGVVAYWAAIRSLSPSASLAVAFAVATLGTMASAVPVSLNGWGVREGTVAVTLAQMSDFTASDASLVAILNGLVIGVTGLFGLAVSVVTHWGFRPTDGPEAVRRRVGNAVTRLDP